MKKPLAPGKVSKAEQRVIIAKDALAQLKLEKLVAAKGHYLGNELYNHLIDKANGDDRQSAQPFLRLAPACAACAKGALFLSTIRKYNKVTVEDVVCDDMRVAERIFGKQWDMIEAAFEQWDYVPLGDIVPEAVYEFGKKYQDNNERLQAILKNIISNKGTFKP